MTQKITFLLKGMKGGICQVSKRYNKVNNEFCPDYDPKNQNFILNILI